MERISKLNKNLTSIGKKNDSDDDVVIVSVLRSPITRAKKRGLKDILPDILLAEVLKETLIKTKINPNLIEDVCIGNVLQNGAGSMSLRTSCLLAGLNIETPCVAINRLCSSGLEAVSIIASKIKSGEIQCGIGGGVESMSQFDMNIIYNTDKVSKETLNNKVTSNCYLPMGITSENVSQKYNQSRLELDKFALNSFEKAKIAQEKNIFETEIVPITYTNSKGEKVTINKDDGIRKNLTLEKLSKLKPSFKKDGLSHAGNSSQISDGAAVVLLCNRRFAKENNLKPLMKFINYKVVGVPPEIMGVGPAYAIPKCLNQAGLELNDIDIFEINEAFASQALWTIKKLNIDMNKVNPNGGAIAIGHPLACTGSRMISSLNNQFQRTDSKYGIVSMCIGTGMGACGLFKKEIN